MSRFCYLKPRCYFLECFFVPFKEFSLQLRLDLTSLTKIFTLIHYWGNEKLFWTWKLLHPFLEIMNLSDKSVIKSFLSNVSLPVFLTCLRPITRVSFHKIWNFGISSITKNFSSKSNSALSYRIIIALNDKFLRFLRLFLFSIFVMLVYYFNACLHVRHSV